MTMKRLLPSLLASTLLLSAGHALAGSDLSVTGRIQSGACNLALGNGGTIDLGTLSRKDLKENDEKSLHVPDVTLAIDCQTPTKVAIKSINNRENAYGAYGLGSTGRSCICAVRMVCHIGKQLVTLSPHGRCPPPALTPGRKKVKPCRKPSGPSVAHCVSLSSCLRLAIST
jgi:type 1 fimbria pilin